jgi:hypothetical protein
VGTALSAKFFAPLGPVNFFTLEEFNIFWLERVSEENEVQGVPTSIGHDQTVKTHKASRVSYRLRLLVKHLAIPSLFDSESTEILNSW